MIDTRLRDKLTELRDKERKINEFKSRLRVKGRLVEKTITKKGNMSIILQKDEDKYKFIVLRSHKDLFKLAEKLTVGIPKLRLVICTQLKALDKGTDNTRQTKLR